MHRLNRIFLFLSFLLVASIANGISIVDSLHRQLTHVSGIEKILILADLSDRLENLEEKRAQEYAIVALQLLPQLSGDSIRCELLNRLGRISGQQGDYFQAILFFEQSALLFEQIEDNAGAAVSYSYLGEMYVNINRFNEAIDYYKEALVLRKRLKNKINYAAALSDLGATYLKMSELYLALEYYEKSIVLLEGTSYKQELADLINNAGLIYNQTGSESKALLYFARSLKLVRELEDYKRIGTVLEHMGDIYIGKKDSKKALSYYQEASKAFVREEEYNSYFRVLYSIANVHYKNENFNEAIIVLSSGRNILDSLRALNQIRDNCLLLSRCHLSQGNYKSAYQFLDRFADLNDSIYDLKQGVEIARIESRFEADIKKKEIKYLKQKVQIEKLVYENQQVELGSQKLANLFLISGILAGLVLLIFVMRSNRNKKKANNILEKRNVEINLQKLEIEEKNTDLAGKNRRITDSIEYAQFLQEALLPKDRELASGFKDYFVFYRPRDIVSGDFYWYGETNNKVFIAAVDCTGHGVPGAFVSMLGNDLLNKIILENGVLEVDEILDELYKGVRAVFGKDRKQYDVKDGMDIALCAIERGTNKLEFAGALRPAIILSNGQFHEIKGDYVSIGGRTSRSPKFTRHVVEAKKGDKVYLFSDGYTDQFGGVKRKKYLIARFKTHLLEIEHLSMREQKNEIVAAIEKWQGDEEQVDDILVLGLEL